MSALLRRAARIPQVVRNRLSLGGLILLYHRVATAASDPYGNCVRADQFAAHLELLVRRARPMPLRALVETALRGRIPERAVAVTFDDGYADNLEVAKPILERYGIPATVFVVTERREREPWWDELEGLLLGDAPVPAAVSVDIADRRQTWPLRSEPERRTALRALYGLIQPLPPAARDDALADVARSLDRPLPRRPANRMLRAEELRALEAGGLIDIGAHTVTHALLAAQPLADQEREIRGSKAWLEEVLGHPVHAFAYPYGHVRAFGADAVALVARAGFSIACTAQPDLLGSRPNPLRLPRIAAGAEVERLAALARWLRA